jgi:cobalamin biosynthetic protein CobC
MTDLPHHGGDLAHAARRHGDPEGGWLDLSTGINPFPYPAPAIGAHALTRLPSRASLARLLDAARDAYDAPAGISIIATPGTEIAIRLLPLVAPAGKVAIVEPTYGSHDEAWAGREVVTAATANAVPDGTAVVVIASPNNPDGRITSRETLNALAQRHALVVIDEAFADVAPDASFVPSMAGDSTFVLRSFGKFYGLAGLRLGFAIGNADILDHLQQYLGDWPVSGAALEIGETALRDYTWRTAMRQRLKSAGAALRDLLEAHQLRIVGHTDLFVLVETDNAVALHDGLAQRGIWTRAFAYNPRWLRIGLPGPGGMERLSAALAALR